MAYDRFISEKGVILGPIVAFPVYRVIISGPSIVGPDVVDVPPFSETGYSTLLSPTYSIGNIYYFDNYWMAYGFCCRRAKEGAVWRQ